jgi:hypothetical protein
VNSRIITGSTPPPLWEAPELAQDSGKEEEDPHEHEVDVPQCLVDVGQLVSEALELAQRRRGPVTDVHCGLLPRGRLC